MKKRIVYILLIFFYSTINSQISKLGKITYEYDIQENFKKQNDIDQNIINKFYKNLKESKSGIKYQLIFKDKESNYSLIKSLDSEENKNLKYAILITGGQEEVYIDLENRLVLKKIEMFGENFIVKSTLTKDWIFTQETKNIGGYICYKAVLHNNKPQINKPDIEAWYSPKIPANFGPKGFGNLPGLILELKVGPIIYFASKIELNLKEKLKINKPTQGKLVTEEEFDEILQGIDKFKK
jgi:GLPGLI family protein